MRTLDHRQETLAKSIGDGHRIFYGVAGSGKTLLLLSRAKLLATHYPEERIQILCYNISLASHLRSILHNDNSNPHFRNIRVSHFHMWAKDILGRLPRPDAVPNGEYDRYMGELLLSRLNDLPKEKKYDSICVDEAHTFEPIWFKCCVAALKEPETGNLIIVSDGSQKLYRRGNFSWESVGVRAKGRTVSKKFNLDKNYRNTQEILSAAWSVLKYQNVEEANKDTDYEDDQIKTFPIVTPTAALRNGMKPILQITSNQSQSIVKEIQKLQNLGYRPENIAVIYKEATGSERSTIYHLVNQMQQLGLGAYWISESRESKLTYNINQSGVRIVTTLSSLGLEFKVVFIMWVEQFSSDCLSSDLEISSLARKQLYVGMTRAQDILYLFASGDSKFIHELKQIEALDVHDSTVIASSYLVQPLSA